ncbi:T9SS type A sorting domain-containing protein [Hymenobacter taeanensis]|uniref:T9SS type A sorting domain-containing protein n=1 Tax=Hymenobacter taeanensis TaxID=2735321 RepID=A0A6M6BES2_9BACT|nr:MULTISPECIES: T9SS type A sorting domain-containing protein [Hymenobacter]QJX46348.1 T9SS type A sorting domain-containing protein [Hymenobacter taeanensis]UOQ80208.1 T9SS type A sorting domain-containing protein [Hymenobacter sp. 5414T-23]
MGAFITALSAASFTAAWAEGSKNLTPGIGTRGTATGKNNYIGYLQHNDGGVTDPNSNSKYFLKEGAPADQRLYIRVKAGETLYYGVRRVRTNSGNPGRLRLQLKYSPTGTTETVVNTNYLEPLAPQPTAQEQPNLAAGPGVIATPEEAAAGPRYTGGPTAGYNPISYTNTTNADQDFWIEFMEVDGTGAVTATQNKAWYDLWDFTVRDATSEKTGRLYSKQWSFTAAGGTNELSTSFGLYPLIPNPNFGNNSFFVKRVSYAGIQPFGVILVANSQGTTVAGNFKAKRKSQVTNVGYPEYKLFVNNPDPTIYPTSPRPGNPTATTTCANGVTTFTLNVDQAGFGIVFIDGDSNGQYDRTQDRVLEKSTVVGNNTYEWDGKTDSGVNITQTTLTITFSSGVGPVNFPIWDCEQAPTTGISVQDVRPGNQGAQDYVFWNDSLLGPDFSTPYINPIGSNTVAASHRWGANKGDQRLVNSYAVGLLARGNAIQIAYNPATACASSPPVVLQTPLPVELVRFVATLQNGQVQVRWATASERYSAYFEVERSVDGRTFQPIGHVVAAGTSTTRLNYLFTDVEPAAGTAYYRLRQVDIDGKAQYSSVVTVASLLPGKSASAGMRLYPNPAVSEVNVSFSAPLSGPVTMRILDVTGRVLWQEQRMLPPAGTSLLQVPTAQLPEARLYLLQVQSSAGIMRQHFCKQ